MSMTNSDVSGETSLKTKTDTVGLETKDQDRDRVLRPVTAKNNCITRTENKCITFSESSKEKSVNSHTL